MHNRCFNAAVFVYVEGPAASCTKLVTSADIVQPSLLARMHSLAPIIKKKILASHAATNGGIYPATPRD